MLQAMYAGNLLYFGSLALSELSVLFFVANVTPVQSDRHMLVCLGAIILSWGTIGFIVSAAECGSPIPWDYTGGHCVDRVSITLPFIHYEIPDPLNHS